MAVLGSIMNAVYRGGFPAVLGVPEAVLAGARASLPATVEAAATLGGNAAAALREAGRAAFLHGLSATTALGTAVLLAAAVVAWRLLPATAGGHAVAHG